MKKTLMSLTLCALAASACALEADTAPRDTQREVQRQMLDVQRDAQREAEREVHRAMAELPLQLALGDQALAFAGRELEGERVVKGAPYCATAVHESIQPLGDGNRIVRRQSSQLCRDGEGRTRREVQREGTPKVVYINDPVAKESWVLYPDQKRVQRLRGNVWMQGGDLAAQAAWQASMQDWGERMKEQAGRWKEWAAGVAERARSADAERVRARAMAGEPGIVIEQELGLPPVAGASAPERRRELRVIRASELPPLPALPAPPAPMNVPPPMAIPVPPMPPLVLQGPVLPREGGTTTALAPKEIDGVKVTGERTTWTIEAGRIGNEKPIVISREVWRSPELMLTVQSRDADPRSGEQNYRLEKIKRGEPDPALMKPPADFSEGSRRSARPAASAPGRG
jgi:Ni/Co efflux regulator RcnB